VDENSKIWQAELAFKQLSAFKHLPEGWQTLVRTMENAVQLGHFTAWSAANQDYCVSAFWADEWIPKAHPKTERQLNTHLHPVFDLASLSKPLLVPLFLKQLRVPLEELLIPCSSLTPATSLGLHLKNLFLANAPFASALDLMNHTAGFLPWLWLGGERTEEQLLNAIFQRSFDRRNHTSQSKTEHYGTAYSDLGYFVLGRLIENFSEFKEASRFSAQLDLLNTNLQSGFFHSSELNKLNPFAMHSVPHFPYVSFESENHNLNASENFGPVNDTNANMLSTRNPPVWSVHAGLFGSVCDVQRALKLCLNGHHFWANQAPANLSQTRFQFGLDTPEGPNTTAGTPSEAWAKDHKVIGHTGYTGTSFWMTTSQTSLNSEKMPAETTLPPHCVLLTNRTARRTRFGSEVPRIFLISQSKPKELNSTLDTAILLWNNNVTAASTEEVIETCRSSVLSRTLAWNFNDINAPNSVNPLRQMLGRLSFG
jgi:hypothetical protein